jgi:hypothetical protein
MYEFEKIDTEAHSRCKLNLSTEQAVHCNSLVHSTLEDITASSRLVGKELAAAAPPGVVN